MEKEIIERLIKENATTPKDLERIKRDVAKKYHSFFPTNTILLQEYHKMKGKDKKILSLLKTRPIRSLSGVVNISVLTKPFPCPGKCIYCPEEENMPKSYLKEEPAVMRAILTKYHPKKQVETRLKSLEKTGHPTYKIELRIVGGTWSFYPEDYRHNFIKMCYDACNKEDSKTLEEAQKKNEQADHRIVCLSVETRPDYINEKEIESLRKLGVTMVEMGIQSLSEEVLEYTKRGHTVKEIIEASKLLKDSGFKICYQVMMNLPKSSILKDIDTFQEIFNNPFFKPDFLKIYPCLVIKNTKLYSLFKEGKHKVYNNKELTEAIIEIKKNIIPRYVRIQRLFRDIPAQNIEGGCKISNLREDIKKDSEKNNWSCQCIRCREVRENYDCNEESFLFRESYKSSGGKENLLTMENKERTKLYGLLRLRNPDTPFINVLKDGGIIREIRTYGKQLIFENKSDDSPQHKGIGKKLIKEAERITKEEFKKSKISVISGIGVRDYWKKEGYKLEETYMTKSLK